jgi:hypothetical protein
MPYPWPLITCYARQRLGRRGFPTTGQMSTSELECVQKKKNLEYKNWEKPCPERKSNWFSPWSVIVTDKFVWNLVVLCLGELSWAYREEKARVSALVARHRDNCDYSSDSSRVIITRKIKPKAAAAAVLFNILLRKQCVQPGDGKMHSTFWSTASCLCCAVAISFSAWARRGRISWKRRLEIWWVVIFEIIV